jgi:DNA repair protein RadD
MEKLNLRPYQKRCIDAAIEHFSRCGDSACIEAATGSGKSILVSKIAEYLHKTTGGRILCTAPSKELVEQNHKKYTAIGKASMFSASAGKLSTRHSVVFGTPMTIKNHIKRFSSGDYCAIIIDEAHTAMTPTMIHCIQKMQEANPSLAILGLTATPYRLGTGYIYNVDENGKTLGEDKAKNPLFFKLLCRITANELIDKGYLTPPTTSVKDGYDTSKLEMKRGKYTEESLQETFEGHGRKTSAIVEDVVNNSAGRMGIMFFGATIQHCHEIASSLPANSYRVISGEMKKSQREKAISEFKQQKYRYIINRDVLTTGFDAPHVDVVAILRRTESAALLQQIIGRALRLHPNKKDALILDYAQNIESHFPDGDIFSPSVEARLTSKESATLNVTCPDCGYVNEFAARDNPDNFDYSDDGYFVDALGEKIENLPSHHGRRCQGYNLVNGHHQQCGKRWIGKECEKCGHDNDIAARYCKSCKHELVDPNEKLVMEFRKIKRSTTTPSSDKVLSWNACLHQGMKNLCVRIDWVTECRSFSIYYTPAMKVEWVAICEAVYGKGHIAPTVDMFMSAFQQHAKMPDTITAYRNPKNNFYSATKYNEPLLEEPDIEI